MSAEPSLLEAVIYGILAAVSSSLGKGLQKYGLGFLEHPRNTLRERRYLEVAGWLAGTTGIVSSAFFVFAACAHGAVSLVAALSGTGLVALVVFSTWVLEEPIGRRELAGISAVILGTVLVGSFDGSRTLPSHGLDRDAPGALQTGPLLAFSVIVLVLSLGAALWSVCNGYRNFGVVFGSISGYCGGISVFYQKAAMLHCACVDLFASVPAALQNPYFYLFALTGVGDFVVTQYALTRAKAVTVVPCYQAGYMLVPMAGGIVAFHERFNLAQAIGVFTLAAGAVVLAVFVGRGVNPGDVRRPTAPEGGRS